MPRTYPADPIIVDDDTWVYTEQRGVCVIREVRDKHGVLIQTENFLLPWRIVKKISAIRQAMTGKGQ